MLRRLRHKLERRLAQATADPSLISEDDKAIIARARPYTMTSDARLQALIDAVRYCQERGVPGSFLECGVWRGGSVLTMILVLQELGVDDRDIYLYDTFEGMTEPTEHDTSQVDRPALEDWTEAQSKDERPWSELFGSDVFNEEAVRELLSGSGYPQERIHITRGPVEETIPGVAPDQIALLRLDTDWYESTRHELHHLWPRLSDSGVLIIDDYGHWEGARRAVDEFFGTSAEPVLLNRIDYTGRIAIKH
jgi:hypothetical protein